MESDARVTTQVLYDADGLHPQLVRAQREAEREADFTRLMRESLADLYENVYKLSTAALIDPMPAALAARSAAFWAANTVGLANRYRYRSSHFMFQESCRLPNLPTGYRDALETLLALHTDVAALREAAGYLWRASATWAEAMGVRWDPWSGEGT